MAMYGIELNYQTELSGYVATEYLTTNTEPKEIYKIKEESLIIAPGTKIEEIDGAEIEGTVVGTGTKITINEKQYTLVVLGDTTGDGEITPLDYVKVKNHIMNISNLDDCYNLAADANGDGSITPLDYVKIKNHIMKSSNITV